MPGLRRDEVARRAAISPEYYLRLEQGRVGVPSAQVLHALAGALLLDATARIHLRRLATGGSARAEITAARIAAVMRQWRRVPTHLTDHHRDVVSSNPLNVALTNGRHRPGTNMLQELFAPRLRGVFGDDWERVARVAVGTFRFDLGGTLTPRAREIAASLRGDPVFRDAWERHDVAMSTSYGIRVSPDGFDPFDLRVHNLRVPTLPGHQVTIYTAAPGTVGAAVIDELRAA